jgi:hypothetical protein
MTETDKKVFSYYVEVIVRANDPEEVDDFVGDKLEDFFGSDNVFHISTVELTEDEVAEIGTGRYKEELASHSVDYESYQ